MINWKDLSGAENWLGNYNDRGGWVDYSSVNEWAGENVNNQFTSQQNLVVSSWNGYTGENFANWYTQNGTVVTSDGSGVKQLIADANNYALRLSLNIVPPSTFQTEVYFLNLNGASLDDIAVGVGSTDIAFGGLSSYGLTGNETFVGIEYTLHHRENSNGEWEIDFLGIRIKYIIYSEDNLAKKAGIIYQSDINNNTSQPPTNWTDISYKESDEVQISGTRYVALVDNSLGNPQNSADWIVIPTYNTGSLVIKNGLVYESNTDNNTDEPPTNWTDVGYVEGDIVLHKAALWLCMQSGTIEEPSKTSTEWQFLNNVVDNLSNGSSWLETTDTWESLKTWSDYSDIVTLTNIGSVLSPIDNLSNGSSWLESTDTWESNRTWSSYSDTVTLTNLS